MCLWQSRITNSRTHHTPLPPGRSRLEGDHHATQTLSEMHSSLRRDFACTKQVSQREMFW